MIDTIANGSISHTYPGTGTYDVTLWVGNSTGCGDDTTIQVYIGSATPAPTTNPLGPTLALCQGDTLIITAQIGFQGYLWSTGETSRSIQVTTPGTYEVRALGIDGCYSVPTTMTVTSRPSPLAPFLSLIGDPTFCEGDSVEIVAPFGASAYNWRPGGQTTQSIVVKQSGTYSVEIANQFNCFSPSTDTTITVISLPRPTIFRTAGTNILSSSDSGQTFSWYLNGNPIAVDSISFDAGILGSGTYTVKIMQDGCESELSDPFVFTANSITETWLGVLDIFPNPTTGVVNLKLESEKAISRQMYIYNLLGQEMLPVIEIPARQSWRGTVDLSAFPAGIYLLKISTGDHHSVCRIIKR